MATKRYTPEDLERMRSVSISSAATPTRTGANRVNGSEALEKQWNKDFAAYRRLKQDGLKPYKSDGAAELEKTAESRLEVEQGASKQIVAEMKSEGLPV